MGEDINLEQPMKVIKVVGYDENKPRKTYNQVMAKAFKRVTNSTILNSIYNEVSVAEIKPTNKAEPKNTPTMREELIEKINSKLF